METPIGNLRIFTTAIMLAASSSCAFAACETVSDIRWTYSMNNGEATIDACQLGTSQTAIIPSTLGGYPVTSIGADAFWLEDKLVSITIPEGVRSIGSGAFNSCKNLSYVGIPSTLAIIGDNAFMCCSNLTSLAFGSNVTNIGKSAFHQCYGLTRLTIGAEGNGLVIGPNVMSIGNNAFGYCKGLESVTMKCPAQKIGQCAFVGCTGLKGVYIDDLETWCSYTFDTYTGTNPLFYAHDLYLNGNLVEDLTIPASITDIGIMAFGYCHSIKRLIISEGVETMGKYSFSNCINLECVTFPRSMRHYKGFGGCEALRDVYISDIAAWCSASHPNGDGALSYAKNLYVNNNIVTELIIPEGVTDISDYAFYGFEGIKGVHFPDSLIHIGNYAFADSGLMYPVIIPSNVIEIVDSAFSWCRMLDKFIVVEANNVYSSVNGLLCNKEATSVLLGPPGIPEVIIPGSATNIADWAFYECFGVTNVVIPASVKSIGWAAFYACINLTSVIFKGDAPTVTERMGEGRIIGSFYCPKYYGSYIVPPCTAYVPQGATGYDVDADGKWQTMTVVYVSEDTAITVGGNTVEYERGEDGRTLTFDVAEGTDAHDIALKIGDYIVTAGFAVSVNGTKATAVLKSPYEVEKPEGASNELWAEDDKGNVTLNVAVVPGLYYAAASATSLDTLKCPGADTPATVGMKLVVDKPNSDTQGFYKVWVSDMAINAD